jgi:hypothetical protein
MAYFFWGGPGKRRDKKGAVKGGIKGQNKKAGQRPAWLRAEMRSGPSDHAQYQCDQCQNDQNMDHTANAIYENAQKPSDQ